MQRGGFFERGFLAAGNDYICAHLGEFDGDVLPDATACTGNKGSLVVECLHNSLLDI